MMPMPGGPPPNLPKPLIAGLVPGGYLARVLAEDGTVLESYKIRSPEDQGDMFTDAAQRGLERLADYPEENEVTIALFDGDTGRCVGLIATTREKLENSRD